MCPAFLSLFLNVNLLWMPLKLIPIAFRLIASLLGRLQALIRPWQSFLRWLVSSPFYLLLSPKNSSRRLERECVRLKEWSGFINFSFWRWRRRWRFVPGWYERKNSPELQILRQIPPILCEIRGFASGKYIIALLPQSCRRQTMVEITDSAAAAGGSLSSIPGDGDKTLSHFLFVFTFHTAQARWYQPKTCTPSPISGERGSSGAKQPGTARKICH